MHVYINLVSKRKKNLLVSNIGKHVGSKRFSHFVFDVFILDSLLYAMGISMHNHNHIYDKLYWCLYWYLNDGLCDSKEKGIQFLEC